MGYRCGGCLSSWVRNLVFGLDVLNVMWVGVVVLSGVFF